MFSPNGRLIASTEGGPIAAKGDSAIKIWDVSSGELLAMYPWNGYFKSLQYATVGNVLAAADFGSDLHLLELVGLESGPVIVSAVRWKKDVQVTCPACSHTFSISPNQPGSELTCPQVGCGTRLKLNLFVIRLA
jgi:WD40 repeat protein